MSRIGKQPIAIPSKVKVEVKGQKVSVEGPKGRLDWELPARTSLKVEHGKIVVSRAGDDARARALHGLSRALVNNMVRGVSEGFVKRLEKILKEKGKKKGFLSLLLESIAKSNEGCGPGCGCHAANQKTPKGKEPVEGKRGR